MRVSERQRVSGHRRPAWPGNATLSVRTVPTAYDGRGVDVTVATPSCCCCCCCLATIASAATFVASEANFQAEEHQRSKGPALALALVGLPMALLVAAVAASGDRDFAPAWLFVSAGVFAGFTATALLMAGASGTRAVVTGGLVAAATAGLIVVEAFAALFTAFFIELAAPLFAWLAYLASRAQYRNRVFMQPVNPAQVPYPRPPVPPPAFGPPEASDWSPPRFPPPEP